MHLFGKEGQILGSPLGRQLICHPIFGLVAREFRPLASSKFETQKRIQNMVKMQ